jgi:hypothetical protein
MNRFMSYISSYFQKDISHYPELYQKSPKNMNYTIDMAGGVLFHDTPDIPRPLNWRSF